MLPYALVRSLIESILKRRLKVEFGEFFRLNDLALQQGVYSKRIWNKVAQIRRKGNSSIHGAANGKTASGVEGALEQAKGYLRDLGIEREIVVTDGIRYRMYEGSINYAHIAYANLDRLKVSASNLFARMSRR